MGGRGSAGRSTTTRAARSHRPGLSPAERTAVSVYTGGEFPSINAFVQNDYQVPAYAADDPEHVRYLTDTVTNLERAVNQSTLDTPTAATRAIPTFVAEQRYGPVGSHVGSVITEHRFISTTTNATPPAGFGEVTITYHLAPGTTALDINHTGVPCTPGENELLLGPHQHFRIVTDQMHGTRRVITLESHPAARRTTDRPVTP